ncbi:MAG TPA: bifunctional DNA primase/polymerase [Desulfobacterales bacterium]|nr:bifunctional DNA primase/polymerase [Desulfobacterales bacterium]
MEPKNLKSFALYYLSLGWSVIPVRPKDKRPAVRWLEYQHRQPREDEISRWFDRWPGDNIGIITGRISGPVVIDIDSKYGGDQSLSRLEQENGSLPCTIEAVTGGGGRHIYYAHPGGVIYNKIAFAPGIDVRGDGGYVVAHPPCTPPACDMSGQHPVIPPA